MIAAVRINTSQKFVMYRDCIIQEAEHGWIALDDEHHDIVAHGETVFACIAAVEDWHENRAEAAWLDRSATDDSAYRRDMAAAGRGHLL